MTSYYDFKDNEQNRRRKNGYDSDGNVESSDGETYHECPHCGKMSCGGCELFPLLIPFRARRVYLGVPQEATSALQ